MVGIVEIVLSLVEGFSVMKYFQISSEAPYMLLAGSLWHKVAYNRTFLCMEATTPLCHKERARSKQNIAVFYFQNPY